MKMRLAVFLALASSACAQAATWSIEQYTGLNNRKANLLVDGNWKIVVTGDASLRLDAVLAGSGVLDLRSVEADTGKTVAAVNNLKWIDRNVFDTSWNCVPRTAYTEVLLPDTVTAIYKNSFHDCPNLTRVVLGNGLKTIDFEAFNNCTALTDVSPLFPTTLKSVGVRAFANCPIQGWGYIFAETIGERAFASNCLSSVTFCEGVTNIGVYAFQTPQSSLTVAPFPASLEKIGDYAFNCYGAPASGGLVGEIDLSNCAKLSAIPPGCFFAGKFENVKLPPLLNSIGIESFRNCQVLTNVSGTVVTGPKLRQMRETDGTVGSRAFMNCPKLRQVTIPWGGTTTFASIGQAYYAPFADTKDLVGLTFWGKAPVDNGVQFLLGAGKDWTTRIFVSKAMDQFGWDAFKTGSVSVDFAYGFAKHEWSDAAYSHYTRYLYLSWAKSPLEAVRGLCLIIR